MTELSSDTTQQILLQLYCREQTEQYVNSSSWSRHRIYDSETFLAWRETKRDFVVRDIENRVWVKSCPAGYITEVHFKGDGTLTEYRLFDRFKTVGRWQLKTAYCTLRLLKATTDMNSRL